MEERSFQRRIHILGMLLALIGLVAFARLFWLQIIRHDHYKVLASEEQLRKFEVLPERGDIYLSDRGQTYPVALNRNLKRLYADPRFIQNQEDTANKLAGITGDNAQSYLEAFKSVTAYVVLKHQLEPATAEAITALELPGIGIQDEPVRFYPEGDMAAQVLGFVNADGNGQYGIEQQFNDQLSGERGLLKATTDVRGIPIATSDNYQVAPKRGSDVVLTIDRNIQAKVEAVIEDGARKYNANSASAVLLDPKSGAVLAMADYPSFDPAKYSDVSDYSVFSSRPATNLYEPGSVIKAFTMSTGLDNGVVTPDTTYEDHGSVTINDQVIENAAGIPTGTHTMNEVLTKSINTGVIFVLDQLGGGTINPQGKQALYDYFDGHFHFGHATGVDLPGEPDGTVKTPDAADVDYANMTFGQGITATMLQVAVGYAALANGGTLYRPYVVDAMIDPYGSVTKTEPKVVSKDVLSTSTISQIQSMLQAVVEQGAGGEAKIAGYKMGGKSGTAQIPNPAGGYFTNRDIGSFIEIGPLDDPQFVLMVRIDEPQIGTFASAAARPLATEIMRWLLNYRGIPPTD